MKNKKIHIILYIIFISGYVCGQNKHIIFIDDSIYLKKGCGDNGFYYNLKDTLQDGLWLLYDVRKKDSTSKYKNVIIKGQYKNFLREGVFETNYYSYEGRKWRKKFIDGKHICSYLNGKKHGLDEEFHIFPNYQSLISLGEYINGKKNGMFLYFQNDGRLSDIYNYSNDSLKEWNTYDVITPKVRKWTNVIIISANEFKYTRYFYESNIYKLEIIIKDGIIEKYFIYDNSEKMIDSGDIGINIHYLNPLKTPNFILAIQEENIINSTTFKEYIKKGLKEMNYVIGKGIN